EAIRADLDNLDLASLGLPLLFSGLDVRAVGDELRARLTEELDYQLEAANQRAFADWYRGHPFIHVPEVVAELCGRRVLTTDLAALRVAIERAGFIAPGAPVPDERLAEFSEVFWGPIRNDEVTTITADYASQVSRRYLTGRATDGDVIKWAGLPPAFVILQRINFGLLAILGRLEATANWRRVATELWPTDGPPSTALGEE